MPLALSPSLLLADEPTAHLDYLQVEEVLKVLRTLASGGRVVVVATHDQRLLSLADHVVELVPDVHSSEPPQTVRISAGDVLFEQGSWGELIYVVQDGEVDLVALRSDGSEEPLNVVGPGGYFGEMGPMFNLPRSATSAGPHGRHTRGVQHTRLPAAHHLRGCAGDDCGGRRSRSRRMSSDSESHASPSWSEVDPVALLAGVDLFADVTPDQLSQLAASCTMRTFSRGQVVWRAGDYAEELLVVVSGELEVRGPGPEGHQEVLGWIRAGECVGEMAIVLDERRSATVVTGRPVRAMALHKENFAALIRDDHRLLTSLTKLVTKRAASLATRQPGSAGPLVVGVTSDPGTPGASLVAEAIAFLAGGLLRNRALLVRLTVSKHSGPLPSDARAPDIVVRDRGLPPVVEATVGSGTPHEAVVPIIESVLRGAWAALRAHRRRLATLVEVRTAGY